LWEAVKKSPKLREGSLRAVVRTQTLEKKTRERTE
jgi:hypothetical protein